MIFIDFIQVAGVMDQAEAELLVKSGVHYLGFPLRLAVHLEDLSEQEASTIIKNLEPPARGVLITYLNRACDILEYCHFLGASIVQLHGDINDSDLREIKEVQPGLAIIKSLVIGQHPIEELREIVRRTGSYVDAYIADTFDPETGASGATGKTHDWRVSRQLVRESPRPVILAGGLDPANVRDAILTVHPAGVDAHTGLGDVSGRKSEEKVKKFVTEAREAFRLVREAAVLPAFPARRPACEEKWMRGPPTQHLQENSWRGPLAATLRSTTVDPRMKRGTHDTY